MKLVVKLNVNPGHALGIEMYAQEVDLLTKLWDNEDDFPTVALSRRGGSCVFRLDKVAEHDSHAPSFSSPDKLEAYLGRVVNEAAKAVKARAAEQEVEVAFIGKSISEQLKEVLNL